MVPTSAPARPPAPAVAAAVLAVLSAVVPALLALVVLALHDGEDGAEKWLWTAVPGALAVALVVGALLLLRGRSWLALVVPATAVAVLVVVGRVAGGSGVRLYGVLSVVVPLVAALLASRPAVRSWVRARRSGQA